MHSVRGEEIKGREFLCFNFFIIKFEFTLQVVSRQPHRTVGDEKNGWI